MPIVQMPVLLCQQAPHQKIWSHLSNIAGRKLFKAAAGLTAAMRGCEIKDRINWDDPVGVNCLVAIVVMAYDVIHVHRFCNMGNLIQFPRIGPKVREIDDPLSITFEVEVIHHVKADQRGEKSPICLCHRVTDQIAVI